MCSQVHNKPVNVILYILSFFFTTDFHCYHGETGNIMSLLCLSGFEIYNYDIILCNVVLHTVKVIELSHRNKKKTFGSGL